MKFFISLLKINLTIIGFLRRVVIPYNHLGKISNYLHSNNKNNWLKRRVQPLRNIP